MSTCITCGKPLGRRNTSGLCRGCFLTRLNRSDGGKAKRIASLRETLSRPENRLSVLRQRRDASRSRLAWCPLEYRDTYRTLTRSKMLSAATARSLIEKLIDADARAYARTGQLQQSERCG